MPPDGARPRADVIIASGENFPDGLAAAGLAGQLDSPVLLVGKDTLPTETVNALAALGAVRVHVMGGLGVISQSVRDQLTALGYQLIQTYSGANRYDTSAKIAAAIGTANIGGLGGKRTAILTVGTNFADALAAGSPAFFGRHPILLTDPNTLSPETSAAITSLGIQNLIIMGGTGAVSQAIQTQLNATGVTTTRIAGTDRANTAQLLANLLITATGSGGFGYQAVGVVVYNGFDGFADGLSAGPMAGKAGYVLLPTDDGSVPTSTNSFMATNKATIALISLVGGTSVISASTASALQAAATTSGATATITAVHGLTTGSITFSEAINPASLTTADFSVLSGAPAESVVALAPDLTKPTNTSWTITFDGALDPGDVISIVDGTPADSLAEITTAAAAAKVSLTSVTVIADTIAPVVTLSATPGRSFTYTESESTGPWAGSYTPAQMPVFFTLAQGTGVTAPSFGTINATTTVSPTNPLSTLFTWVDGTPLVAGNTVTVPAGTVGDAAGNVNLAATVTVVADAVNPTALSSKLTTTNTGVDSAVLGVSPNVLVVTSKTTGATGLRILIGAPSGNPAPLATYIPATSQITITLGTNPGSNSGPALAALLNATPAISALVTASGGGSADMGASVNTALAGGTTTQSFTVTFSETVTLAANSLLVDKDGNLATTGDQMTTPAAPTLVVGGVFTQNGPFALAASPLTAGVSKVVPQVGIADLSGNALGVGGTITMTS